MFPTASCMSSMVWYSYRRKVSNWRKWNIWTSVASCLTHSICASPRPPLGAAASNWSHATAGLACPFGSFGKVPFGQGMSYWIWLKISLNYILKIHHKSLFTRRNDSISGSTHWYFSDLSCASWFCSRSVCALDISINCLMANTVSIPISDVAGTWTWHLLFRPLDHIVPKFLLFDVIYCWWRRIQ
jgi:hypothetical protein